MKNIKRILILIIIINMMLISCSRNDSSSTNESSADSVKTMVDLYGQLQVDGNRIVDQHGNPMALHGMSLFWSQWGGKYYNFGCIKWLRDDWKCNLIRAAMAIEHEGYLTNPAQEMEKIRTVIDACISLGIYVIIDWHDHNAHQHTSQAVSFFRMIATQYGDFPNIIYEIYNEPEQVSWTNDVKPYSEAVVEAIREIDPDNIIIAGSPRWSQDVDVAANDPLDYTNIAYALHFYAASHKQDLRNKAVTAMNKGLALFASEWGTSEYTGDGFLDYNETNAWLRFMDLNKISWCNWSVSYKDETTAIFDADVDEQGGWNISEISESGRFIRTQIIARNDTVFSSLGEE